MAKMPPQFEKSKKDKSSDKKHKMKEGSRKEEMMNKLYGKGYAKGGKVKKGC